MPPKELFSDLLASIRYTRTKVSRMSDSGGMIEEVHECTQFKDAERQAG